MSAVLGLVVVWAAFVFGSSCLSWVQFSFKTYTEYLVENSRRTGYLLVYSASAKKVERAVEKGARRELIEWRFWGGAYSLLLRFFNR